MSNIGPLKTLDEIGGGSLLAIQAAMGIFQRHRLDLAQYKILVFREKDSLAIVFTDRDGKENARRTVGVREGANAEMSARDLGALMSNMGQLKPIDTIQGTSFPPIRAATAVFQQRVPNQELTYYTITVVREGSSLGVMFTPKDRKPGSRGNTGTRPGFEVELDSRDMRVLRSNFIR